MAIIDRIQLHYNPNQRREKTNDSCTDTLARKGCGGMADVSLCGRLSANKRPIRPANYSTVLSAEISE